MIYINYWQRIDVWVILIIKKNVAYRLHSFYIFQMQNQNNFNEPLMVFKLASTLNHG